MFKYFKYYKMLFTFLLVHLIYFNELKNTQV